MRLPGDGRTRIPSGCRRCSRPVTVPRSPSTGASVAAPAAAMSPASAFHAQLASIMEVLANAAVAEICELVDGGYALLQLEIRRGRRENEQLRRKVRLLELRAARAGALRALAGLSGPARAAGHHGDPPRRARAPPRAGGPDGSVSADAGRGEVTPSIKMEAGGESWSERDVEFCGVVDVETRRTEAPPTSIQQDVAEGRGASPRADWMSEDAAATCWPTQQNPEREGLGHPSASVGVSSDSGGGGFSSNKVEHKQQGALSTSKPPQLPGRSGRLTALHRRERWRQPDGAGGGRGPGRAAFVCTCCGKTLASLKNLNTHMRVHTGEKPFACGLCGKRFSDPSNLKRHQSVHTGERRYGCVHCGKRFAQSGSLKVHLGVHTDCKQFRCFTCGKTFISGSHLRRHAAAGAAAGAAQRDAPPRGCCPSPGFTSGHKHSSPDGSK